MGIGPVEYLVVKFPGSKFTGEIAPALQALVDSGTVRVLDIAFVTKDTDGSTAAIELENSGSDVFQAFEQITSQTGGLLNEEDLMSAAEGLEPGSSAALLVWEDVWATRFVEALEAADAELVDIQRIPRDIVMAALDFEESSKRAGGRLIGDR
jgi:hypothetical protein